MFDATAAPDAKPARSHRRSKIGGRRFVLPGVALLVGACALSAAGLTPANLLTPQLETEPAHLIGISDGTVLYFDENRVKRTAPTEQFVQVNAIGGRAAKPNPASPAITTADGQVIFGKPKGATDDGAAIQWEHPALGKLTVPLTLITSVRFGEKPLPELKNATADTVVLANGDTLGGFVEALEKDKVLLTPEGQDQPIELPLARVAGLLLSNPVAQPKAGLNRVVLNDGSRVWADGLDWSADGVSLKLIAGLTGKPTKALSLKPEHVVRIDLASAGLSLADLSTFKFKLTEGGQAFGVRFAPQPAGSDFRLHAPAVVAFDLGDNAQRLAATVTLDLPGSLPEERRALAHCVLVIKHGPDESHSQRITLTPDEPATRINLPLHEATLQLIAEEGEYGPILDRIRLVDAVVLIENREE